ncbi:MAG TPA: hypothetical protein VK420_13755, partial [Longimicrobium sp.]|nr:hypothetical protein [Longimicrobium sp.]
ENGRATDAAFAPALDVRQFNATAELLNREGFGGWILHALRKTLWFLGSQHIPDAKKIAAVASMLLEWQARGSKPVDLP